MKNMIIIGGGIAAINAIKAIREVNPAVAIDLFGAEKFYPYNRIKLTKSLLDALDPDGILLQKKEWYESNRVNLHLDLGVQGLDTERREIILPGQKRMGYHKLLLANGAANRPPVIAGLDPGKMNTIRTLEDVRRLQREMEGKEVILNIGGGIQGLETAWVLRQQHKEVIIAEIQSRLFPYQLDERAAAILEEAVAAAGVKVLTNAAVVKADGGNRIESAALRDGRRIPCEMVLYATGIQPNIALIKGTPLQTNQGIIVDARMQTNIENIYAAGDVAEFDGKVYGLWNIAVSQGKTAGYNMAQQDTLYQPVVPVTTLNAYGISLFSMGDVAENAPGSGARARPIRTVSDEDRERHTYRRIFVKDDIIRGAIVIGDTGKSPLLKTAIERQTLLEGLDWDGITVDELMERLKDLKK